MLMMMYIHDDKEEGVDIGCVLFLSSSSRLFIYILLIFYTVTSHVFLTIAILAEIITMYASI